MRYGSDAECLLSESTVTILLWKAGTDSLSIPATLVVHIAFRDNGICVGCEDVVRRYLHEIGSQGQPRTDTVIAHCTPCEDNLPL